MTWADVVAFAEAYQPGARAIECPRCKAAPYVACALGEGLITPNGEMHRDRVEASAGKPWPPLRTPEQTGSYIVTLTRVKDELAALLQVAMRNPQLVADQLELLRHCPHHAAEVGRVLRGGGERHGVVGSAPIWTVGDHLDHAMDHLRNAMVAPNSRDRDTGALDMTHAAARCHLGGELELVRR